MTDIFTSRLDDAVFGAAGDGGGGPDDWAAEAGFSGAGGGPDDDCGAETCFSGVGGGGPDDDDCWIGDGLSSIFATTGIIDDNPGGSEFGPENIDGSETLTSIFPIPATYVVDDADGGRFIANSEPTELVPTCLMTGIGDDCSVFEIGVWPELGIGDDGGPLDCGGADGSGAGADGRGPRATIGGDADGEDFLFAKPWQSSESVAIQRPDSSRA